MNEESKIDKPVVFVITPFNEDFLALFDKLSSEFEELYLFNNAGDMDNQRNILKDIIEGIANADIIIADLTGLNANVFYELGLAHAMGKKTIIITQDIDELPFDIKSYRAIQYSLQFNKLPDLLTELTKLLAGAIDGSIKFGNPVSDFAPNFNKSLEKDLPETSIEDDIDNNSLEDDFGDEIEKGFIDYVEEIKSDSDGMRDELNFFAIEMSSMGDSVNSVNNEISRANNKSGSIDSNFAKTMCRKLAETLNEGANKLKVRIENITQYWSRIENNYLELLDNPFVKNPANATDLKESIKSLQRMQKAIGESDVQINGLITSSQNFFGVERRLNRAVRDLIVVLQDYLSMTDTISSSIDRIINKSNIVISTINM